jgi:hypothetical protein
VVDLVAVTSLTCACVDLDPKKFDHLCEKLAVIYPEVDMSFRYSSEFRHQVCERMLAGEPVKDLAAELATPPFTSGAAKP